VDLHSHITPSPDETVIADDATEEAARAELEQDAAAFRCSLSNGRVSRLGDMTIVRFDLYRAEQREIVGLAMSIEQSGRIHLGIYIF
jgi:hypothetical protein